VEREAVLGLCSYHHFWVFVETSYQLGSPIYEFEFKFKSNSWLEPKIIHCKRARKIKYILRKKLINNWREITKNILAGCWFRQANLDGNEAVVWKCCLGTWYGMKSCGWVWRLMAAWRILNLNQLNTAENLKTNGLGLDKVPKFSLVKTQYK